MKVVVSALAIGALAGCSNGDGIGPGPAGSGHGSGSGTQNTTTSATGGSGGGASAGSSSVSADASVMTQGNVIADASVTTHGSGDAGGCGLPANVASMLTSVCTTCHSSPPLNGAPMPLVTYADLVAPSVSNPSETVGALCVTRMQSTAAPMPPAGSPNPSASAAAAFASWVSAGMPEAPCGTTGAAGTSGSAGSSSGTSAPATGSTGSQSGSSTGTFGGSTSADAAVTYTPVCTSNMMAPATFGPTMEPGYACVSCHNTFLAGTVYPTAHEPTGCDGVNVTNAIVKVTDANGAVTSVSINNVGNFYTNGALLVPPVQVEVDYNGATRAMVMPLTIGDCNSCHTEQGDNGAPGRIMLP